MTSTILPSSSGKITEIIEFNKRLKPIKIATTPKAEIRIPIGTAVRGALPVK
jgi:hypothetical protein